MIRKRLKQNPKQFWMLDGTNIFYRYFFAPFRNLSVPCILCQGEPGCIRCEGTGREQTKATWQFTRYVINLIREKKPDYFAIAFDGRRENLLRTKLYPDYKGNRKKERPEGVTPQLRRIKEILRALQIPVIVGKEHEADDILASLANTYSNSRLEAIVVSRDKDLAHLCVNENIFIFDHIKETYTNKKNVPLRFGVEAAQLLDYFALLGDAGDNIGGVDGFGPKTASRLLGKCFNLNGIENSTALSKKLRENLILARESGTLALSRKLLTLETNIPVPGIVDLVTPTIDLSRARSIFRLLNFKEME